MNQGCNRLIPLFAHLDSLLDNDQVSLVLTFLERGTMLLGRTSLRFLQLSTGRVRAATQVPSDEETRFSRCFLCNCSSASELSPGTWSAKTGWRLQKGKDEHMLLRKYGKLNLLILVLPLLFPILQYICKCSVDRGYFRMTKYANLSVDAMSAVTHKILDLQHSIMSTKHKGHNSHN